MIKQAKRTYSPLGKNFEEQAKTTEDQRKNKFKQLKIIKKNKLKWININSVIKKVFKVFKTKKETLMNVLMNKWVKYRQID